MLIILHLLNVHHPPYTMPTSGYTYIHDMFLYLYIRSPTTTYTQLHHYTLLYEYLSAYMHMDIRIYIQVAITNTKNFHNYSK